MKIKINHDVFVNNFGNVSLSELASMLNCSKRTLCRYSKKNGFKFSREQISKLISEKHKCRNQFGDKNGNWKGGISKNNYRYTKRFRDKYRIKYLAQCILQTAVKRGKIKRLPCIVCNNIKSEAHHYDYNKPLDVIWLCDKHHKEKHMAMRLRA